MRHLLLALHILFAIFAVGPLVHAATTASRGVREGDPKAIAGSARTIRLYGWVSVGVLVFGMGLVQSKWHHQLSDTWIWLSLVLYVLAIAAVQALLVPSLQKAGSELAAGRPIQALVGRVAAAGGIVALVFAVIVFLMVYKPGN
jgi:uncharacterized membrane protein